MSNAEPADELAEALQAASLGAEQRLTRALVKAARSENPHTELVATAASALAAGADRDGIIQACDAARLEIRTHAGASRNFEDPTEDHVLDLLTGWCRPGARL